MQQRTIEFLRAGQNVIYNATNLTYKNRKQILAMVRRENARITAKVLVAPIEVCKERNARRERKIPNYVYNNMLKRFQVPFKEEGFHDIQLIYTAAWNTTEYFEELMDKVQLFGDQKKIPTILYLFMIIV